MDDSDEMKMKMKKCSSSKDPVLIDDFIQEKKQDRHLSCSKGVNKLRTSGRSRTIWSCGGREHPAVAI